MGMDKISGTSMPEAPALAASPADDTDAAWELVLAACEVAGADPKLLFPHPAGETRQGQRAAG